MTDPTYCPHGVMKPLRCGPCEEAVTPEKLRALASDIDCGEGNPKAVKYALRAAADEIERLKQIHPTPEEPS